ncbi:MAG: flagellar biosynthesis protein FlhF [Pseudobdellovibrionaceae bacterium]
MQVKKFEAKSMKEALEMVKVEMGPDAIILSVRDNKKSYGLVGEGSIEITAAVSEKTLQQKKYTEAKMNAPARDKFLKSSAKNQKETIQKMVDRYMQSNNNQTQTQKLVQPQYQMTSRRYIEIEDDVNPSSSTGFAQNASAIAEERIKDAAQKAWVAMQMSNEAAAKPTPVKSSSNKTNKSEMFALKEEIENLRKVVTQFQNIPQDFKSQGFYPGADYGLVFEFSAMFEKLVRSGVAPDVAAEILEFAQEAISPSKRKNQSLVDGWVARYILDSVEVMDPDYEAKIHCFFGPSGSGKTSSLIKLASHLMIRKNKKIALVTTDTHKVGAIDQMKIYSQILNLPLMVIRQGTDWNTLINYMSKLDTVLVDFPGLSLKNSEELQKLKSLMPPTSLKPHFHLVLSASMKDSDINEIAKKYSLLNFRSAIFNGLDESVQQGNIYNFIRRFKTPLHSFGLGTKVPEDFEFATKERVLDLIFKITQSYAKDVAA